MLIQVDPVTGHVAKVEQHSASPLMQTVGRFAEEMQGYEDYKVLAKSNSAYTTIAYQEFQHALMAMNDLVMHIKQHGTEEEKAELAKFISAAISMP